VKNFDFAQLKMPAKASIQLSASVFSSFSSLKPWKST